jgi:hypothetical protein
MGRLVAGAGDKRQIQHLSRLDSPHANAWLTARPSCMDGNDAILPPKVYRTAVARLLRQLEICVLIQEKSLDPYNNLKKEKKHKGLVLGETQGKEKNSD